ncbi:MAG: DUF1893 domain-containing protein [Theionarchaea archaeon]|nr:MAG: hypothetical protein AYK18_10510 [Theionarchaea archaeon DG-70]MBU7009823.1 DUF1893 domain-containing protein [Theionarchaea archaeon]
MYTDLESAKREFKRTKAAFVIVKDEKVVARSAEKGVAPFFFAANGLGEQVKNASLADKIVGKAVALLTVNSQMISVYTPLISDPAVKVLNDYNIYWEADQIVAMILNRNKDDQCPIEKMVTACDTPEEAFSILKRKFRG